MLNTSDLLIHCKEQTFSLYIHIPFCQKKCIYCDFLSIPVSGNVPDEYMQSLMDEFGHIPYPHSLKSIYFGGGTPSLLRLDQIDKIISLVNKLFIINNPEISIEINPDDISEDWIKSIKDIGINRVSIGIQSFLDKELMYLGRRHDAKKAKIACEIVSENFRNWSLDLIYGIPNSTYREWEETIKIAVLYEPSHISTYNLTYEEGTPLFENKLHEKVDDDVCLELYKIAENMLCGYGYEHYEISNFAKPDFKCIHNLTYWHNEPYIGLGAGAFSYINNLRCANYRDISKYIEFPGIKEEVDSLTEREIKIETLIQYFRLSEGIHEETYYQRFNTSLSNDFGSALGRLVSQKLLEYDSGIYRPTKEGFYLNNKIGIELLLHG